MTLLIMTLNNNNLLDVLNALKPHTIKSIGSGENIKESNIKLCNGNTIPQNAYHINFNNINSVPSTINTQRIAKCNSSNMPEPEKEQNKSIFLNLNNLNKEAKTNIIPEKVKIHSLKGSKSRQKSTKNPRSHHPSHNAINKVLDLTRNNQVIESARDKGQTMLQPSKNTNLNQKFNRKIRIKGQTGCSNSPQNAVFSSNQTEKKKSQLYTNKHILHIDSINLQKNKINKNVIKEQNQFLFCENWPDAQSSIVTNKKGAISKGNCDLDTSDLCTERIMHQDVCQSHQTITQNMCTSPNPFCNTKFITCKINNIKNNQNELETFLSEQPSNQTTDKNLNNKLNTRKLFKRVHKDPIQANHTSINQKKKNSLIYRNNNNISLVKEDHCAGGNLNQIKVIRKSSCEEKHDNQKLNTTQRLQKTRILANGTKCELDQKGNTNENKNKNNSKDLHCGDIKILKTQNYNSLLNANTKARYTTNLIECTFDGKRTEELKHFTNDCDISIKGSLFTSHDYSEVSIAQPATKNIVASPKCKETDIMNKRKQIIFESMSEDDDSNNIFAKEKQNFDKNDRNANNLPIKFEVYESSEDSEVHKSLLDNSIYIKQNYHNKDQEEEGIENNSICIGWDASCRKYNLNSEYPKDEHIYGTKLHLILQVKILKNRISSSIPDLSFEDTPKVHCKQPSEVCKILKEVDTKTATNRRNISFLSSDEHTNIEDKMNTK